MQKCQIEGYNMTAGTQGSGEGATPLGLIEGHAYSVLSVHEV